MALRLEPGAIEQCVRVCDQILKSIDDAIKKVGRTSLC